MGKTHSKVSDDVENIDPEFLQELPEESRTRILEHYERMKSRINELNVECNRLKVDNGMNSPGPPFSFIFRVNF